jgi:outer membrane protein OmpA-like peptidoglycan-associated protein
MSHVVTPTRHLVTTSMIAVATVIALTGCATKDWVRQLLGQTDAKVAESNQRIEGIGYKVTSLEGAVAETSEVAKAARGRADQAQDRADQAHGRAEQAYGRADEAYGRADEVNGRLTRLWNNRNARTAVETLHVHFAFDRADLDDGAQTALLTLVDELKQNANLSVDLEGYTDLKGPREYNLRLSQRRAEAVRLYLVERGVDLPRIHLIGRGPLTEGDAKPELRRRVTVRLVAPTE